MQLLLDSCVWGFAAAELRERGHDVVWAGDWEEDPGAREQGRACQEVLERYADELRRGALITVDPGKVRVRPGASS